MIQDAALEMDRLPDARERPIPALLAERDLGEGGIGEFGRVVGRAVDPDLDLVLAWPQMLRHVEGERQEPALVRSDERAVHPDPGIVEHRPEAQPYVIAEPLGRNVDEPAIDADAGPHAQIRELRLPGRRHVDRAHRCRPGRAIIGHVQELPGSIEAETEGGHYGSFGASPRWRPRRRTQVTADVIGQAGSSRRPRIARNHTRVGAHVLGGEATVPPPGMQGPNARAEPARIPIRLPELPMKSLAPAPEPAVSLPRCLSNQHAARRPRTGTRELCPGLSNPTPRPDRGRAAVPSSWC